MGLTIGTVPPEGAPRWALSSDVDTHAAGLSGWQQRYDQLSPGAFQGALADVWFDEVQVFRERTSLALRQACRIRPDSVWCGITLAHDGSRIEGHTVGAGGVMVCGSAEEFSLQTPDGHDILGIVASRSSLQGMAMSLGLPMRADVLAHPTWLDCPPPARTRLVEGLMHLLDGTSRTEALPTDARARQVAQQAVLEGLISVLASPPAVHAECLSFARRHRLVRVACEQLAARPHEVPTVPELCALLHVSRRTLQYAFETVVGTSPLSYLRSLRLNAVRRELATGQTASVQEAAARHGFWSLSQFGSDYRRQFNERPSETLARGRQTQPVPGH